MANRHYKEWKCHITDAEMSWSNTTSLPAWTLPSPQEQTHYCKEHHHNALKHMAVHLHSMSVCPSASVWVLELVLKWGRPCGNTPVCGWEKTIAPISVRLFISYWMCHLAYAFNHKLLTMCKQTKSYLLHFKGVMNCIKKNLYFTMFPEVHL